ncbi:hypothetical protein JTE90_007927 [Oedothorax gibbosus]|uniref:Serine/threonine-protein phosphatase 4 regulatory subunit 1 n=1 Tax=Oedothorax gibbosus TaxID=931172 RepID=A0AAV6VHM5_9ARAC|nr:hypothetical protein JTE90_007927 [Oedothorax gibbosus]
MADIFLEIDPSEEQKDEQPQTTEKSSDEPICFTLTVEEPSDENENKTTKENNDLEVELELDNLYYFESQTNPTFEELATSDYIHNRQVAAKKILESLQKAGSNQDELQSIISIMCKLSEDEESLVRSELVQHIPSIALYCQGHPGLQLVIQQQLVPFTVKLLNDPQIAVRKLAQSALLVLLENCLIGELQLSEWICPLISQLAMCESNLEEQRIEDVTVMSMMIPLVPRSMVMKFFLEPYIALCCDQAFGVRTVCAMRFGTLCKIAGTETTELSLLPSFLNLCSDVLWGVRKACADVFVDVANVVSLKTRREVLPHIFINLLNDKSRFVENAALQSLGIFISTFADPSKTGCSFRDGEIHVDESVFASEAPQVRSNLSDDQKENPQTELTENSLAEDIQDIESYLGITENSTNSSSLLNTESERSRTRSEPQSIVRKDGRTRLHFDNINRCNNNTVLKSGADTFNTFQYWRSPIPEVELGIDLEGGNAKEIHVRTRTESGTSEIVVRISSDEEKDTVANRDGVSHVQVHSACVNTFSVEDGDGTDTKLLDAVNSTCQTKVLTFDNKKLVQIQETTNNSFVGMDSFAFDSSPEPLEKDYCESLSPEDQDIIPPKLLSKYTEIFEYYSLYYSEKAMESCAYSFPAVAFTLGRRYWPCIRATCKKIASDLKWSVRLPIASSLHALARVLGPEISERDLLPIFLEYLIDEDEVKMCLLRHLPQFLEQLSTEKRRCFLNSLPDFSEQGYDCRFRNWRFRCALAEQFQPTCLLYTTQEVYEYFLPIALGLLRDRVFTVRVKATEFVAHIIKLMYEDEETNKHCETLLSDLVTTLRSGKKWINRQTFVFLCDQLAKKKTLPKEVYEEKVLPHLFHLARDSVPNVRLAVARCLVYGDYLENLPHPHSMQLMSTLELLFEDKDADVRHIVCLWRKFMEVHNKRILKSGVQ